jgi:hypothetical protein
MEMRSQANRTGVCFAVLIVLALLALAACTSTGLAEEKACEMARAHMSEPKYAAGWQYCDFERFPSSCYKDVEVLECFEFLTKEDEGWAAIQIEAMGEEFNPEDGTSLGRTRFQSAVELRRTAGGWEVMKKESF